MSSAVAPADGPSQPQQTPAAAATPPGQVTESVREHRGWLMVLATVIASITYASGLSPPGGFEKVYIPRPLLGDPKRPPASSGTQMLPSLYLVSPARCRVFYYANTAAFALSLSIILLLGSQDLRRLARVKALEILVALDVMALLVAYIAAAAFGELQLLVCAGLVLVVPLALVVMSSRLCGKYFWDEL